MPIKVLNSILLVEDDKFISTLLTRRLEEKGYTVYQVFKGDAVERMVIRYVPDCIILDIGLPKISGYDVFLALKKFYLGPIVFLTSNNTDQTEITCLQLGADDFITKETSFDVFYERLKRSINNYEKPPHSSFTYKSANEINLGSFIFDKKNFQCKYQNNSILLTNMEFELLYFFLINKDRLITRDELYRSLKGVTYDGISRTVDVSLSRIKEKLLSAGIDSGVISSIRGRGYMLVSAIILQSSIVEPYGIMDTTSS
jgi:DNA-binding response OmpR family regulator